MSLSRRKMYFGSMRQASPSIRNFAAKSVAGLMLGLGFLACTSDNVAGGGPSGTEAGNAITATLYNEDGTLAKYATATLIMKSSLSGEANAYTVQADSNGVITIDSVSVGDYIMEASLEGNSVQIDVTVANEKDSVKLGEHKLQKPVYLSGSLVDYGCKGCDSAFGTLKFFGLNHSTIVTNGMFSIGGLPAGNLNFAFIPNMGAKLDTIVLPSIKTKAGDSIIVEHVAPPTPEPEPEDTTKTDTVVKPEGPLETLLLDDFIDGDNIHNMGTPYANSWNSSGTWFLIPGDGKMGNGPIAIEPKVTNYTNPFIDIIETDDDGNKQVHFKVDFPDSSFQAYPPEYTDTASFWMMYPQFRFMDSTAWESQWWTTFGIEIGETGSSYDLSVVDSIVFEAWGTGSCTFEFIDENSKGSKENYYNNGNYYNYEDPRSLIIGSMDFELPAKKSRIAIAVADIVPDIEKRKKVSMISWVFHDDVEFYFDNLKFVGYDLENIWNTK